MMSDPVNRQCEKCGIFGEFLFFLSDRYKNVCYVCATKKETPMSNGFTREKKYYVVLDVTEANYEKWLATRSARGDAVILADEQSKKHPSRTFAVALVLMEVKQISSCWNNLGD